MNIISKLIINGQSFEHLNINWWPGKRLKICDFIDNIDIQRDIGRWIASSDRFCVSKQLRLKMQISRHNICSVMHLNRHMFSKA